MQIITTLRSRLLPLITKLPPLFFSLLHRWLANCYLLVFLTLQFASHLHKKLKAKVEASLSGAVADFCNCKMSATPHSQRRLLGMCVVDTRQRGALSTRFAPAGWLTGSSAGSPGGQLTRRR